MQGMRGVCDPPNDLQPAFPLHWTTPCRVLQEVDRRSGFSWHIDGPMEGAVQLSPGMRLFTVSHSGGWCITKSVRCGTVAQRPPSVATLSGPWFCGARYLGWLHCVNAL